MRLEVLVPGGSGQLGRDLAALASDEISVLAPGSAELDLTQVGDVVAAVTEVASRAQESGAQPVVINASAYTAVDSAETQEKRAFAVNADGPRVLAAVCSSRRATPTRSRRLPSFCSATTRCGHACRATAWRA